MRNTLIAAICAALPALAAAQYKCTAPGGRVAYQQTPCEGAATGEKLRISTAQAVDAGGATRAASYEQRELARLERRQLLQRSTGSAAVPMVGMTAAELQQTLGGPSTVSLADYGRGLESQQVYYRLGVTWYVYLRDGVVTSMQAR